MKLACVILRTSCMALLLTSIFTFPSSRAADGPMIELLEQADLQDGAKVVAKLPAGTRLFVARQQDDWTLVKAASFDQKAWIKSNTRHRIVGNSEEEQQQLKKAYKHFDAYKALIAEDDSEPALQELRECLAIERKVLGEHPDVGDSLHILGINLSETDRDAEAEPLYLEALRIRQRYLGNNHAATAETLNNLGVVYRALGKDQLARDYYERALTSYVQAQGEQSEGAARTLNNLGHLMVALENYDAARGYFERAVSARIQVFGEEHPETRASLEALKSVDQIESSDIQSREELQGLLAKQIQEVGEQHADTANTLFELGRTCYHEGDDVAAKGYQERALAAYVAVRGENHSDTAFALNDLGLTLYHLEDYQQAREKYERAVRIYESVHGENHVETARTLANLADTLAALGDFTAARSSANRALSIRQLLFGKESEDTAWTLASLGEIEMNAGDHVAARDYLGRAAVMMQQIHGDLHESVASMLNLQGNLESAVNELTKAREYYEQALRAYLELFGEQHEDTAIVLFNLGDLSLDLNEPAKAILYFQRALRTQVALLGGENKDVADTLNDLGNAYRDLYQFDQARAQYHRSLEIFTKLARAADTAMVIQNLGSLSRLQGDFVQSRKYLDQSLALNTDLRGENSPAVASVLTDLGDLMIDMDDNESARQYLTRALGTYLDTHGEQHSDTAYTLNSLGNLLSYSYDDHDACKKYYERALAIYLGLYGKQHPETARTMNYLGGLALKLDDYATAGEFHQNALDIYLELFGEEHVDTATTLNSLGLLAYELGDFVATREYLERALAIYQKQVGEQHVSTADTLLNLGNLLLDLGDYTSAEDYYQRALAIYRSLFGEKSTYTAGPLNGLGILAMERKEFDKSREFYERALNVYREKLGDRNTNTAGMLNNLGQLSYTIGEYAPAKQYLEEALKVLKAHYGDEHVDTASAMESLGELLRDTGHFEAARQYIESALATRRRLIGTDHPNNAMALIALAELDVMSGDQPAAMEPLQEARRIARRHLATVLPTLSSGEQIRYLAQSETENFAKCLSYAQQNQGSSRVRIQSVGWLINGKAIGQEALAEGSLLARPETIEDVRRLRYVRSRLSQLGGALAGKIDEQKRREEIAILESEQQQLHRKIASAGTGMSQADPWITPGQLRDNIHSRSVMIQIARFRPYDFQPEQPPGSQEQRWGSANYVAWVIPASGEGDVQIIELGPSDEIDTLVSQVVGAIVIDASTFGAAQERAATKELRPLLKQLARRILTPLLPYVEHAEELILSPDGSLWLVPWAALLVDEDYLIEKYNLRYVVSGREVVSTVNSVTGVTAPVIVANPDYDFDPLALAEQKISEPKSGPPLGLFATRSLDNLPRVSRLPGTAREAELIAPALESYSRLEPQLFVEQAASEAQIKSVFRPRVLVLSTHGFFFEDQTAALRDSNQSVAANRQPLALSKDGKLLGNPLLRCGLLFAGCNHRENSDVSGMEDGVLTGLEVVGIDLRGTELVVLSACDTGRGDVRCGEGVAGLRQAFQFAGADAVAASLWRIPDAATVPLMQGFFQNLADGQTKSKALCQAQRAMIDYRRKQAGVAHPFFWAAFTLTGK